MSNGLKNERSPYLRQHAEQPVDWQPWCAAALERARWEDKPVFLSIGYSTCHWCHVMAEESFEDAEVARLLNEGFVAVKVDREERPDVDSVYMRFCTAMNGSGGWPLTVIMTPEQRPFFVATYIPRDSRGETTGLIPLLTAISRMWRGDRARLLQTAGELTRQLAQSRQVSPAEPSGDLLEAALRQLSASYDRDYGGFGSGPKFPSPHHILLLLRASKLGGDKSLRAMAEHSLRQMYRGGIYDHLGGGFSRYSTDREWLAPHFEKTLYDNALLAYCYAEAWQEGRLPLYRAVAEDTLDYCLRELKAPGGGFYCGQDADSGGVEGAYYLFTPEEVEEALGQEDGRHFCQCYDITPEGNFHGKSIPNLLINQRWSLLPEGYDGLRERLRLYREGRMALGIDDKILTGWNGLMLMALAKAARVFEDPRYLMEARELAAFMSGSLYGEGRLRARLCRGELRYTAGLTDYAFYALGLLELYGADREPGHIIAAAELAGELTRRFRDGEGGFFDTAEDAETLVLRPKELFDGALPSGNSAAALLFDGLFRLTGAERWRRAREEQLSFICGGAGQYPAGCAFGLLAMLGLLYDTRELVCVLPEERPPEALKAMTARYAPELTVLVKTPKNAAALAAVAPFTADMEPQGGKATYYLCSGGACGLPVTSPD